MVARNTKEQWLEKFAEAHGVDYDYADLGDIPGGRTPITIRCREHGPFLQTAQKHAAGQGCPLCARRLRSESQRMSTEAWIERARAVHTDHEHYDYAQVDYQGDRSKVRIVCRYHGPFEQTAGEHTQGRGCTACGNEAKRRGRQKDLAHFVARARAMHGDKYDYSRVNYGSALEKVEIVCPKHGAFWQTPANHGHGYGCQKCVSGAPSKKEDDLFAFVKSLRPDAEQSNRKLIAPKELDIVVPALKLAIEFNGVYWHSDRRSAAHAANTKRLACAAIGYRLITIACEDWKRRRPQMEQLVRHALGATGGPRLNARDCEVREVPNPAAVAFLDAHHPQAPAAIYTARFGLYHPVQGLVALMTFDRDVYSRNRTGEPVWDLSRFASCATVRGGASKLFTAARRALGFGRVVSYSANDWFAGGVYAALGFERVAEVPPDYRVYHHALGFRPKSSWARKHIPARLVQIGRSDIQYDPATDPRSEWQIEDVVNALRVWDSGKVKWEWRK